MKTALITGFTGQDGTFLSRLLLDRGDKVVGLVRRVSTEPPTRDRGLFDFSEAINSGQLIIESGDLSSVRSLMRVIKEHKPDQVYNLAAQSHVGVSFEQPEYTTEVNYVGLLNLMAALDEYAPDSRLYQASTSEMYGKVLASPQTEQTRFNPMSPYAIAKTAAHYAIRQRRESGKFASAGILFNHESEIRGGDFVTQKIVREVVHSRVHEGVVLRLGNLNAQRDWGYAGDYVQAMQMMLNHSEPGEFVISSGKMHSVRDVVELALEFFGEKIEWEGKGPDERGMVRGKPFVIVDPQFYRPTDVQELRGDARLAYRTFQWKPVISFHDMIFRMCDYTLSKVKADIKSQLANKE